MEISFTILTDLIGTDSPTETDEFSEKFQTTCEIIHALIGESLKAPTAKPYFILGSDPRKHRRKKRMRMFQPFLFFLVMATSFSGVDLCWFGPPQPSRPPPSGTGPCCMYLHIWAMKTLKLCKGGWVDEAHTTVCRPLPLCRFESKYHTVTMMMLTC